jgi:Ni/Fe-hydrogenase 1 B-type cytochrome subunit
MTGAADAEVAERRVSVHVWDLPLRLTHWVNVFSILGLSLTGYYIFNPFLSAPATAGFLMGTVRFIHFVLAFAFTSSVLFRIYWAFAGNEFARWPWFLPNSRARLGTLREQIAYYTFVRRKPPPQVGHNPLAGVTYIAIYVLFVLQIATGFALYSLSYESGFWPIAFGWIVPLVGAPALRLAHTLVMFFLIAFTIHHVYSAALVDWEERSGMLSSIVTGFKSLTPSFLARAAQLAPRRRGQRG